MEPEFPRFSWLNFQRPTLGLGVHPRVAKYILGDMGMGQLSAGPLELVLKGVEFFAGGSNGRSGEHLAMAGNTARAVYGGLFPAGTRAFLRDDIAVF